VKQHVRSIRHLHFFIPLKAAVNKPMQKTKAMLTYVGTGSDLKSLQLTIFHAEADQVTSSRFLKAFKDIRAWRRGGATNPKNHGNGKTREPTARQNL